MKIHWLTLALNDLEDACEFIHSENPAAAEKVGSRIEAVTAHLARYPEIGRLGRRPDTRELILPDLPFCIVYRLRGDAVQILRVYHTRRKWPNL